ncbi:hypothetical protein H696_04731 [Fonticula alba]|uniref:Importin N-terminal domain-containing protein n=1 Tax=Fonticula alba TaxID=691883 RepID=A0A058Z4K5_FONAL|nr:hypothetical protein H696_04731 [Fonticula alba]KCV68437.1 hypothetical protein H696_04731 [Fonticula alba]|eukprot:XP_009496869.1 hypothetical protein H696_04731 [Fonticula alba]
MVPTEKVVEAITCLYSPTASPAQVNQAQGWLVSWQKSPGNWSTCFDLLKIESIECQYLGAQTLKNKFETEWESLSDETKVWLRHATLDALFLLAPVQSIARTCLVLAFCTLAVNAMLDGWDGVIRDVRRATMDAARRSTLPDAGILFEGLFLDYLALLPERAQAAASVSDAQARLTATRLGACAFLALGLLWQRACDMAAPASLRTLALSGLSAWMPAAGRLFARDTATDQVLLVDVETGASPAEANGLPVPRPADAVLHVLDSVESVMARARAAHEPPGPLADELRLLVDAYHRLVRCMVAFDTGRHCWLLGARLGQLGPVIDWLIEADAMAPLGLVAELFVRWSVDFSSTALAQAAADPAVLGPVLDLLLRLTNAPGEPGPEQPVTQLALRAWAELQLSAAAFEGDAGLLLELLDPAFVRAALILADKAALPSHLDHATAVWEDDDERQDFLVFRETVAGFLDSSQHLLVPVFAQHLGGLVGGYTEAKWRATEAALFCLTSVLKALCVGLKPSEKDALLGILLDMPRLQSPDYPLLTVASLGFQAILAPLLTPSGMTPQMPVTPQLHAASQVLDLLEQSMVAVDPPVRLAAGSATLQGLRAINTAALEALGTLASRASIQLAASRPFVDRVAALFQQASALYLQQEWASLSASASATGAHKPPGAAASPDVPSAGSGVAPAVTAACQALIDITARLICHLPQAAFLEALIAVSEPITSALDHTLTLSRQGAVGAPAGGGPCAEATARLLELLGLLFRSSTSSAEAALHRRTQPVSQGPEAGTSGWSDTPAFEVPDDLGPDADRAGTDPLLLLLQHIWPNLSRCLAVFAQAESVVSIVADLLGNIMDRDLAIPTGLLVAIGQTLVLTFEAHPSTGVLTGIDRVWAALPLRAAGPGRWLSARGGRSLLADSGPGQTPAEVADLQAHFHFLHATLVVAFARACGLTDERLWAWHQLALQVPEYPPERGASEAVARPRIDGDFDFPAAPALDLPGLGLRPDLAAAFFRFLGNVAQQSPSFCLGLGISPGPGEGPGEATPPWRRPIQNLGTPNGGALFQPWPSAIGTARPDAGAHTAVAPLARSFADPAVPAANLVLGLAMHALGQLNDRPSLEVLLQLLARLASGCLAAGASEAMATHALAYFVPILVREALLRVAGPGHLAAPASLTAPVAAVLRQCRQLAVVRFRRTLLFLAEQPGFPTPTVTRAVKLRFADDMMRGSPRQTADAVREFSSICRGVSAGVARTTASNPFIRKLLG